MGNYAWVLTMLAGLSMFLYGMRVMGEGLERVAGDSMSRIIDKLTDNLFKSVLVGAFVTAIIQSSNATLVMVVGFINAGMMTLTQSVGVMLGAQIGTTVTSLLISLEGLNSSAMAILNCLKPSFLAPIAVTAGVIMIVFVKRGSIRYVGEILAGFGVLFIGIDMMGDAITTWQQQSPLFGELMLQLSNPLLGFLIGLLLTVIIQSSSASIGIVQTASISGLLSFPAAMALVLGANVGACVTALLSSIGTNLNAKRAARLNTLFQLIGAVIFMVVLYVLPVGRMLPFWGDVASRVNISMFHVAFNVINMAIMIPLSGLMVKLIIRLVPGDETKADTAVTVLDQRLLQTPVLAMMQVRNEMVNMMTLAHTAVRVGHEMLLGDTQMTKQELHEMEDATDHYESSITQYLMRLTDQPLREVESSTISTMFHVVTDVERIGDHAYIIGTQLNKLRDSGSTFSPVAQDQLSKMYAAVDKMMDLTLRAYSTSDARLAAKIHPLEDVIAYLSNHLKNSHLERLSRHDCNYERGVIFMDIVNSLERIKAYCSNIVLAVEQMASASSTEFDPHEYLRDVHTNKTPEYMQVYDKYLDRYSC